MVTDGDDRTTGCVEVVVRALIGHGERLLLMRHREDSYLFLPGAHVRPGEPVEVPLQRWVANTLGTEIKSASFVAALEHGYRDRQRIDHHELNLIFDVTLSDVDVRCADGRREVQWADWEELSRLDLRPEGLRAGLRSGRFDHGDRWLPWRPTAVH